MVHQREPGEPGVVGGQGDRPAASPPGPRPRGSATAGGRRPGPGRTCARRSGAAAASGSATVAEAVGGDRRGRRPSPRRRPRHGRRRTPQLRGQHPRRDGRTRVGVAAPAHRRRGVDDDDDGRQPGGPGRVASHASRRPRPVPRVSTTVVSPRREPAGDDPVEQRERVVGRVQVVRAAADDAPRGRRRTRSRRRGSGPGRNATCPIPRVRRGPRVRDRAGARTQP